MVQDPALIHQMLRALAPTLDKGRLYDKLGQLLGDSVVTATGRNHVRKRRQVQPAFAHAEIGRYVDIMRAEVAATVAGWEPGRTLDVREAMVGLSLDMLAKTVFAGSLDDAVFRRLRSDLSVVLNDVGVRIMLPDWTERLPLPFNRRFDRARAGVRATINSAVDELQASGHDTGDMLSMLLRAVDEETGEPLTGHQICSEILTLAVAGTETTASVLSWLLYELARNPGIEARVLAELDEVLGERPVALADVTRLTYLNRVITETLRLHHPAGWSPAAPPRRPGSASGRCPPAPNWPTASTPCTATPSASPTRTPSTRTGGPTPRRSLRRARSCPSGTASTSAWGTVSPSPRWSRRSRRCCVRYVWNSPRARSSARSPGSPYGRAPCG